MLYSVQRIFSFFIYVMLKKIYRVGIIIIIFLQMRKWKLREFYSVYSFIQLYNFRLNYMVGTGNTKMEKN